MNEETKARINRLLENISPENDAVFLPGKIHGSRWQVYIVYLNPDANDGNGSFEIEIVDAERILKLNKEVNGNSDEFFGQLPDWFQGEWGYVDAPEEYDEESPFVYLAREYHNADFIGHSDAELAFLVGWAEKFISEEATENTAA